jgi:pheromone shutdown protein TraB
MQAEFYNIDYNQFITILGTAHFTRRSLIEAYEAVKSLKPEDLAIELDWKRFQILNHMCISCPRKQNCTRKCEFIGAADALGNVNANIWLVDMSENEIHLRMQRLLRQYQWKWPYLSYVSSPWFFRNNHIDEIQLWEEGYKDQVLRAYKQRLETLRQRNPHVWQVLIDERNTIMAARLAWITTQRLKENKQPRVLALFGAAHVDGIKELLTKPELIKHNLERFSIAFTPPMLVKRIQVEGD